MTLVAGQYRSIDFTVKTLAVEERVTPVFLDLTKNHRIELLSLCSWCSRINVEGKWQELEVAVRNLKLLEEDVLPNITHGMCDSCFSNIQSLMDMRSVDPNGT